MDFEIDKPRQRKHFFKKPKFIIPAIVILALGGAVALAIHNLNAPAEGSISQTPTTNAAPTDPYANPGTYSDKYISFVYPAHFKPTPSKLTGDNLATVEYTSTDQSERHIDVAVFKGEVNSDSGVTYRLQHPQLYKETSSQLWLEFSRVDGTEDTFFLQHNDLEATVSATAPYGNLNGEALYVASGLKWKQ